MACPLVPPLSCASPLLRVRCRSYPMIRYGNSFRRRLFAASLLVTLVIACHWPHGRAALDKLLREEAAAAAAAASLVRVWKPAQVLPPLQAMEATAVAGGNSPEKTLPAAAASWPGTPQPTLRRRRNGYRPHRKRREYGSASNDDSSTSTSTDTKLLILMPSAVRDLGSEGEKRRRYAEDQVPAPAPYLTARGNVTLQGEDGGRRLAAIGAARGTAKGRRLLVGEGYGALGRVAAIEDALKMIIGEVHGEGGDAGEGQTANVGGGSVKQSPLQAAAPSAQDTSTSSGSSSSSSSSLDVTVQDDRAAAAKGGDGRGGRMGDEGRAGTGISGEETAAPGSMKTDWARPLTLKQRVEEDKRKVERGVCSSTVRYDNQYGRGHMAWVPTPGRYVLMDCHRNQLSNRVRCFRNYLTLAGYLNRTLVVPLPISEAPNTETSRVGLPPLHGNHIRYERRVFFHIPHAQRCYGATTVMTPREVLALERREVGGEQGGEEGAEEGGAMGLDRSGNSPPSLQSANQTLQVQEIACLTGPCYNQQGMGEPDHMPQLTLVTFSPNLTWSSANLLASHPINSTDAAYIDSLLLPSSTLSSASSSPSPSSSASSSSSSPSPTPYHMVTFGDLGSTMLESSRSPTGEYMNGLDVPFFSLSGCNDRLAIHPHPALLTAAEGFVRSVVLGGRAREWEGGLGVDISGSAGGSSSSSDGGSSSSSGSRGRYMAVHWRRGDLVRQYKTAGHVSAQQAGECVARKMVKSDNTSVLFLATDASPEEVSDFEKSIRETIPTLQLHQLPQDFTAQPWAQVLLPFRFQHMPTVRATLDKVICVLADVFLGTQLSSFTQDISRIRSGLRYDACDDSRVCAAEK